MLKPEKVVETQVGAGYQCLHCKKIVSKCAQCGKAIKRGYWMECWEERHNHVRCPVGTEPDVWD
jgi:DNA-directed RNA polymerase subunit RPC12/RpoP